MVSIAYLQALRRASVWSNVWQKSMLALHQMMANRAMHHSPFKRLISMKYLRDIGRL
jgi:hypothetical protein